MRIRYAAPVLAALLLAGCGTAAATSAQPPASASQPASTHPANPVTIVRETGATITPGEVYGSTTVQSWLSADGSWPGGERVDVYTLPGGLAGAQAITQLGVTSSDSQTVIAGGSFYMFVYPADNLSTGASSYPVPPATIAARVHGTVVVPSS